LIFYIPLLYLVIPRIKQSNDLLIFIMSIVVICSIFVMVVKLEHSNRQSVLFWNDWSEVTSLVNWERRISNAPEIFRKIVSNKFNISFRRQFANYVEIFSPQFLILYGDTSSLTGIYGYVNHGMLYIVDALFLVLGVWFLFKNKQKFRWFIIFAILIAPIPTALASDKAYAARSITLIPFLALVISYGINQSLIRYSKAKYLIPAVYFVSVAFYMYHYHFLFPTYSAESWFRSKKDLYDVVSLNKRNYDHIYIADRADWILQWGVYGSLDPSVIKNLYGKNKVSFQNIDFLGECIYTKGLAFDPKKDLPPRTFYISGSECHKETETKMLIRDAGEPLRVIWKIYTNPPIRKYL
jgi:hypothetical protein